MADQQSAAPRPFGVMVGDQPDPAEEEQMPLPPGIDYPDELHPVVDMTPPDPFSNAVGDPFYVSDPRFAWARTRPIGGTRLKFSRHYVRLRLIVDIFQAWAECTDRKRADFKREAEERRALAEANGFAYAAVHRDMKDLDGSPLDSRLFKAAMARVKDREPKAPVSEPTPPLVNVGVDDPIGTLLDSPIYVKNASVKELPWAWEMLPGRGRLPLTFARWHAQVKVAVDEFLAPDMQWPRDRRKTEHDVAVKREVAGKAGVGYLVVRGRLLPTKEQIERVKAGEFVDVWAEHLATLRTAHAAEHVPASARADSPSPAAAALRRQLGRDVGAEPESINPFPKAEVSEDAQAARVGEPEPDPARPADQQGVGRGKRRATRREREQSADGAAVGAGAGDDPKQQREPDRGLVPATAGPGHAETGENGTGGVGGPGLRERDADPRQQQ